MSVAALEACLLKRLLDRPGQEGDPIAELAPRFFAEVQALLETPWSVAMLDFVFPDTRGQRPADFATTLKFGIALTRLAAEDPIAARVVELRHFAGLSIEDAAATLGMSRATAYRHWTYARAWLRDAIAGDLD
jgi:predicted DNA-binding protein (UPF0251 family)